MPAPTDASVRREGDSLVFAGTLERPAVAALWPQVLTGLAGVRRFDLRGVNHVDSAGLALLAELAGRAEGAVAIDGAPSGLAELCSAYRLDTALAYAG